MLIASVSSAQAYAKPSAELVDASARAGDVVHFSITGATAGVSYQVAVGDRVVQDGTGRGHLVPGTFTVPDLGDDARTVNVEILISGPGKPRTVDRDLGYLGRAHTGTSPPVTVVPAPVAPGPAPSVTPQQPPQLAPGPVQSSVQSLVHGGSSAPAATPPAHGQPHHAAAPPVRRAPHHAASRGKHRPGGHHAHRRHARHAPAGTRRASRRIVCPCRFGHLEPTHAGKPGGHIARGSPEPTTAPPAIKNVRVDGGGLTAAAVVPALAALAALTLGATAIARRRRVASRLGRSL